ncbi:MAG: Restriction enzyme [Parcubacteria group bacterium GW2011_GWB1_41_6]|nr:MAG: Restriction enzyme [Parcubacteria group bacterium GW2011_GWB1_41_6]
MVKTMKINRDSWREFKFDDIFLVSRGQRLVTLDQIGGDIAYISSSKQRNGVDNYITPPDFMVIYQNALTLNNSGSVGYCFYHLYKFVASDHCTIVEIKDKKIKLNSYVALFLKPIIESMKSKYNFAREINNERLKKEMILLPAIDYKTPDWNFMQNYIKKLSNNIKYNNKIKETKISKTPIELKSKYWNEFKIKDVFDIQKGERLTVLDRTHGDMPLLTASSVNNGISSFIDYEIFKNSKKIFKNKITVDMFCNVFFQEFDYFSDDNIHTLLFKNKNYEKYYENKYVNIFLVSILKELSRKYDYGRQVRLKRFEEEIISLPITKVGELNFQFMERYIKSLSYSSDL